MAIPPKKQKQLLQLLYLVIFVSICHQTNAVDDIPRGHGQILGKHRDAEGHVPILTDLPSPQEFYDKYVSIRRPVVFRGPGKKFPAFEKWTDDYLIKNFGDLEVKLEHKTEKGKTPVGERGVGRDTIRSYLKTYKTKPSYIVSQLPDPMADDVLVPPFMMCGTIYERILESNIWLSAGGTKSMLHRDADHAINCLLNGTKDWILIDPKQEDKIPIAEGDVGYGGFAVLDVDKVNLIKYPKFKQVKWEYANMTPGDCLYLPCGYWHQVRSYGEKNMATTVLFSRIKFFNNSDCATKKLEYTQLSKTGMVWTYPGFGQQTLGNSDPFELKEDFENQFKERNLKKQSYKHFKRHYNGAESLKKKGGEAEQLGKKLVEILDVAKKGYVTLDDIKGATVAQMKEAANTIDPDPANTDYYEHYIFKPKHVRKMLMSSFDETKNKFVLKEFIKIWTESEGSEKMARDVFGKLSDDQSEEVTQEQLEKNIDDVLAPFQKESKVDPSGDYYHQQLKEDKAMFGEEVPKEVTEKDPGDVDGDEDENETGNGDEDWEGVDDDGDEGNQDGGDESSKDGGDDGSEDDEVKGSQDGGDDGSKDDEVEGSQDGGEETESDSENKKETPTNKKDEL